MCEGDGPVKCRRCGVGLFQRDERDPDKVRALKAQGLKRYSVRGLCDLCRRRSVADGTLIDYERLNVPACEVVAEYLAMPHDPGESRASRCRRLAPRMGMQWKSLEKALKRAEVTGREGSVAAAA